MVAQEKSEEDLKQKAIEALDREAKKDEKIMLLEQELKEVKKKLEVNMEKESEKAVPKEKKRRT
jgi:hypothetical protein